MSFRCHNRAALASAAIALAVAVGAPPTLPAQWGLNLHVTQSLVRWDYPSCGDACPSYAQANTPRTSASVAATYDYQLVPGLSARAEARLITKGYTVTGPELRLRYLEVPLIVRLELPRQLARVTPYALGGIAPALKLSCSLESWGCVQSTIGDRRIRAFDLSGVFGGGIELRGDRHAIGIEYRLAHGWRNIGYENTTMRNIVVSHLGATYRRLDARPTADPLIAGGVIGFAATPENTCGVVNQHPGIAGELHFRPFARHSWWRARMESGVAYFPEQMNGGVCRPVRRAFGGSDVRAMSGYATLGPGVTVESPISVGGLRPYARVAAGGFAAHLDHASPGYGRVALGTTFGGGAGVSVQRGARRLATEVRLQTLAPVLGHRVNVMSLGFGVVP
jgi:hypothetical protein